MGQLRNWRGFLKQRLADEYSKHIEYWEKDRGFCFEVFVGARHQGLAAKLLHFSQEERLRVVGAPVVVEEMGVYGSRRRLTSLAVRAIPNTNYEEYEEGEFTAEAYQTI